MAALGGAAQDAPRFNRDIRPILSSKCYPCHGPDANTRKAGLRLDTFDGAVEGGALAPGNPDASELLSRVMTHDPDDRMPPGDPDQALPPEEVDLLRRWIAAGGVYEPHWAFVPPPPQVEEPRLEGEAATRARNPIDAFVFDRLEREGLRAAPEADRETLLRRASLDLTGLPPTLEEMDAFLADTAPDAFERAVGRLLTSPAFGERMAMDWLDVARFADTFGYQSDVEMNMWPWRDWVIKAFNENLPYDQFITWQLAGDLLDNPTREQRLATAFNRLHRQTNEGGSINEEFRVEYVADRTETFSTAFLGMTMACARCHDHKFDPLSQREYFSLFAYFDDIDESGLYSHFTQTSPSPSMFLYEEREEERHGMLKRRIERLSEEVLETETAARDKAETWADSEVPALPDPAPSVLLKLDEVAGGETPDAATTERKAKTTLDPTLVPGIEGQALAFSGDNGVELRGAAAFERSDPFTISLWIKVEKHSPKAVVLHRCKAESDAASRGYEILLDEGRPVFSLIHFWPGNAIRMMADAPLPEGGWVHLTARYDGSSRAAGAQLFVNGEAVPMTVIRDNLFKTILYEGDDNVPLTLAQRFRDSGLKDGALDEVAVYSSSLSALEIRALAQRISLADTLARARETNDTEALAEHYARRVDETSLAAQQRLHEARQKEAAFVGGLRDIMVMAELPEPRTAYLLDRGEYSRRKEPVEPGTPEALSAWPDNAPKNRLGLAQWLTHPDHPLTARVAVNRYWQLFFGRGLVETQEDFGSQGKPPSHPELLDWLARRFIESGWDVKALCREIVLSSTYRQESKATPELRERDPDNLLLARGPAFRLHAEIVRDRALAASGLLVAKLGGPSAKPYQPPGLWEDVSYGGYPQDTSEGLYRRSLYTFIKRTSPPPSMSTFDAGSREVCTVRRERTATPLQALVVLNDPQFVEAARVLAERTLASLPAAPVEERLTTMFRRIAARAPRAEELHVLMQAHREQHEWFAARHDEAARYASVGEMESNAALDPAQVAAATAVAQAIMSMDEFQVRP